VEECSFLTHVSIVIREFRLKNAVSEKPGCLYAGYTAVI
jgi:hypothetical protein